MLGADDTTPKSVFVVAGLKKVWYCFVVFSNFNIIIIHRFYLFSYADKSRVVLDFGSYDFSPVMSSSLETTGPRVGACSFHGLQIIGYVDCPFIVFCFLCKLFRLWWDFIYILDSKPRSLVLVTRPNHERPSEEENCWLKLSNAGPLFRGSKFLTNTNVVEIFLGSFRPRWKCQVDISLN